MRSRCWLFAFCVAVPAFAQQKSVCDQWKNVRAPVADLPPVSYAHAAIKCDELAIYYGGEAPERFRKARWCAFAGRGEFRDGTDQQKSDARTLVWADAGTEEPTMDPVADLMLAMLYQNGEGVRANMDVARHFVCQSGDWFQPGEIALSLKSNVRFEECVKDGGPGRIVNYACILLRQRQLAGALRKQLASTQATLSADLKASFEALVAANRTFRKAHQAEEPNGTSGAVQSGMSNELDLDDAWLDELKAIAAGIAPAASAKASDLPLLDKQLNHDYKVNVQTDCHESFCTTAEEYRIAARAWLRYREAWVQFGKLRWPEVAPDQWRAWLTAERNQEGTD